MQTIRNVLITGGARGLGLGFVKRLHARGHNIAMTDISEEAAKVYQEARSVEELIKQLKAQSSGSATPKCFFKSGDLTNPVVAGDIVDWAWKSLGHVDVVIANAGGDIVGDDASAAGGKPNVNNSQIDPKSHMQVFNRNYLTCWNIITKIAPLMGAKSFGK